MGITPSSLANATAATIENKVFEPAVDVVPRKGLLVGTIDPAATAYPLNTPTRYSSAEACGAETGFGFDLHRQALAFKKQNPSAAFTVIAQAETGVQATGEISITGTAAEDGKISLYCANDPIGDVKVSKDDDGEDIVIAVVAQWAKTKELRATSEVDGVTLTQINVTEKSKGLCGNFTSLAKNLGAGEKTPDGLTVTITGMASGSGVPNIQDALDALGTGDAQNEDQYTDCVHGYCQDETTLNKLSIYDGVGDQELGNYDGNVARPFQWFTGDVEAGDVGLSSLITLGGNRKSDRTNVVFPVPGSPSHPTEIAAQVAADRVAVAGVRPQQSQHKRVLVGVRPGDKADQWTSEHSNRDDAVKAGISTSVVSGGAVLISDLVTFYHPDSVPVSSNIYRSVRNNAITQNILDNVKKRYDSTTYQGISIVENKTKVTDSIDQEKVIDKNNVVDEQLSLVDGFGKKSWIYSAAWSMERILSDVNYHVALRAAGKGFDTKLPVIYSGEGGIMNNKVEADISLAVFAG